MNVTIVKVLRPDSPLTSAAPDIVYRPDLAVLEGYTGVSGGAGWHTVGLTGLQDDMMLLRPDGVYARPDDIICRFCKVLARNANSENPHRALVYSPLQLFVRHRRGSWRSTRSAGKYTTQLNGHAQARLPSESYFPILHDSLHLGVLPERDDIRGTGREDMPILLVLDDLGRAWRAFGLPPEAHETAPALPRAHVDLGRAGRC